MGDTLSSVNSMVQDVNKDFDEGIFRTVTVQFSDFPMMGIYNGWSLPKYMAQNLQRYENKIVPQFNARSEEMGKVPVRDIEFCFIKPTAPVHPDFPRLPQWSTLTLGGIPAPAPAPAALKSCWQNTVATEACGVPGPEAPRVPMECAGWSFDPANETDWQDSHCAAADEEEDCFCSLFPSGGSKMQLQLQGSGQLTITVQNSAPVGHGNIIVWRTGSGHTSAEALLGQTGFSNNLSPQVYTASFNDGDILKIQQASTGVILLKSVVFS